MVHNSYGANLKKMGGSELKNGRVTGGTITLPPVSQTLCTSAFEGGDGRKGGKNQQSLFFADLHLIVIRKQG